MGGRAWISGRFGRLLCALLCLSAGASEGELLGPLAVAVTEDGQTAFAASHDGRRVSAVDLQSSEVCGSVSLPGRPTGIVLSPRRGELYVTLGEPDGAVVAIDPEGLRVLWSIETGHTSVGPAVSTDGKRLYVCNRFGNTVSVIDLEKRRESTRIPMEREPVAAAVTPNGRWLVVANHLPAGRADAGVVAATVALVNTRNRRVMTIPLPNGSTGARGVAVSPDGRHAYVTHILGRHQMPTTQVDRGWMNTNALSIVDIRKGARLATVLLDEVDRGAANPWGVAVSGDGRWIAVSHAGTHEISVIDAAGVQRRLAERERTGVSPVAGDPLYAGYPAAEAAEDLSFLLGLRRRVRVPGKGPRGIALTRTHAVAAEYFSDSLALVPLDEGAGAQARLGPAPEMGRQRRGEMLFHDAALCFQQWQSCSSCHPDARTDGLNWDLLNDGIGNPKNTKSMLLAHRTPPAMSLGVRATAEAAVRAGIRHIQFMKRPEEEAEAIDEYLRGLQAVESPHLKGGELSAAAERGKAIFHGKAGCAECHPAPLYTDLKSYDVGSRTERDRTAEFDTPALVEVWRTAPYNHDGRYPTIERLLGEGNHGEAVGKLSGEEMADLTAFVKSL